MKDNRKYTCDDYFFSRDTPESFYWAGFIAADGTLRNYSGRQISIELSKKDRMHLEKFKKAVSFTGKVFDRKTRDSSIVKISSFKMFNDIKRFNIVPRKTFVLGFPEWLIEHPLVNHFIRGYFDGDGCFYISHSKSDSGVKYLGCNVAGTESFLKTMIRIFYQYCGTNNNKKLYLNNKTYILTYGGTRNAMSVRNFIYENSTSETRMDRKYSVAFASDFVNRPERFDRKAVIGTNINTNEKKYFESMLMAEKEGFNRGSIRHCCNGRRKIYKNYTWKFK